MKKIIIIDTYPTNESIENTLRDCISRFKPKGIDIMLVSHKPIAKDIQDSVNYCIYDNDNVLLPYDLTPFWWIDFGSLYVQMNSMGHSITICKNILTSVSMAKSLGYDFFYFIECDNLFSDLDIDKLLNLIDEMFDSNKKMIFFKQEYDEIKKKVGDDIVYETLMFGGIPSYLLYNMDLPTTVDEFIKMEMSQTLELSFYKKLHKKEDEFLIIDDKTSNFFNESVINKYDQSSYKCEVLKSNNGGYIMFIVNSTTNKHTISFTINDGESMILTPGGWFYKPLDDEINIIITENDISILKSFNIKNTDEYDQKGFIEFR